MSQWSAQRHPNDDHHPSEHGGGGVVVDGVNGVSVLYEMRCDRRHQLRGGGAGSGGDNDGVVALGPRPLGGDPCGGRKTVVLVLVRMAA
mmetsp:Transcript_22644/g.52526  ORF Transcript_22644/g.52526 Transcript_22644/m.52526 type:complete len:89 (+) Transcript_22644:90-356(+)